jgi:hypothetical protein
VFIDRAFPVIILVTPSFIHPVMVEVCSTAVGFRNKCEFIEINATQTCTFLGISIEPADSTSIAARVERLIREAPQSTALLRSTVEILEDMLFSD